MITERQLNHCSENLLEATEVLERLSRFWRNKAESSLERSQLILLKYENHTEYLKLVSI